MFNFETGHPGNMEMFQGSTWSRGETPQDMNRLMEFHIEVDGQTCYLQVNPTQGTNPRPIAGGAYYRRSMGPMQWEILMQVGVGGSLGQTIGNVAGISFDINESLSKNRKMRGIRKLI